VPGADRNLDPWPSRSDKKDQFRQVTLQLPPGKAAEQAVKALIRQVDEFAVVQPLSRRIGRA
jgi:hypothetical protein